MKKVNGLNMLSASTAAANNARESSFAACICYRMRKGIDIKRLEIQKDEKTNADEHYNWYDLFSMNY